MLDFILTTAALKAANPVQDVTSWSQYNHYHDKASNLSNQLQEALAQFNLHPRLNILFIDADYGLTKQILSHNKLQLERQLTKEIVIPQLCNREQLFGYHSPSAGQATNIIPGALLTTSAVVVVDVKQLLKDPQLISNLLETVVAQVLAYNLLVSYHKDQQIDGATAINCKLLLVGSVYDYQQLYALAPKELNSSKLLQSNYLINLDNPVLFKYLLSNLVELANYFKIKLADDSLPAILDYLTYYYQNNNRVEFNPSLLINFFNLILTKDQITAAAIKQYRESIHFYNSSFFINELDSIKQGYIKISTSGAVVGQVNGLVVMTPEDEKYSYGSAIRITALIDKSKEFSDLDVAANLSGSFAMRASLTAYNYLKSIINDDNGEGFGVSLINEQLYSQTDGDSAALASCCAIISALTKMPIKQNIAITGSMDQFGYAQAIGGATEKVEAFYKIAQTLGQDQAGVIIPRVNLNNLQLCDEVKGAIESGKFKVYLVDHFIQAIEILTGVPFTLDPQEISQLPCKQAESLANETTSISGKLDLYNEQNRDDSWFKKLFR